MKLIPKPGAPYDPEAMGKRVRWMSIALGIVLLAMLGLNYWGKTGKTTETQKREFQDTDILNKKPPQVSDTAIISPAEKRIRENMDYLTDPDILKDITDKTETVEVEALLVLLHRSRNLTEETGKKEVTDIDPADIQDDPTNARGKVFRLEGNVKKKVLPIPLSANAAEIEKAWFVELEASAPGGTPRRSGIYLIDKPTGIIPGEQVHTHARFMKLWKQVGPDGKATVMPIFVGKELVPADYSTKRIERLYGLLAKSKELSPEDARRRVNKSIPQEQLIEKADEAGGELIYVEGRISKHIRPTHLKPNPSGIEKVWFFRLVDVEDPLNTATYCIYTIDRPEGVGKGEMVRLYGYFLRLWKHTEEKGGTPPEAAGPVEPILVAKGLDPIDYTSDPWVLEEMVTDEVYSPYLEGLLYLAARLKETSPEQLADQVDPELNWERLKLAPEKYRGKAMHCKGTLARINRAEVNISDKYSRELGVRYLYEAYLLIDSHRAFTVYLLEPPMDVEERELVATDGLFLHWWSFDTKAGPEAKSPIIVAHSLEPVEVNVPSITPFVVVILLAAVGVLGVMIVRDIGRTHKAQQAAHKRRMKRTPGKVKSDRGEKTGDEAPKE